MALLEREIDAQNPPKWKITREAYYALDRAGFFPPDRRTELIEGDIYERHQKSPTPWKITRDAYYALERTGFFAADERTELIEGVIYKRMSPIGAEHIYTVNKLRKLLETLLGDEVSVINDGSMILSDLSEPEPDIIILRGALEQYAKAKATSRDVALVIEVSASTFGFDQKKKAAMYAASNITEYWIVNLNERQVEVYRDPQKSGKYSDMKIIGERGTLSALISPDAKIAVADFLP